VVYAVEEIVAVCAKDWPDWIADRPASGARISAGDPVCTVLAEGPDAASARKLAALRSREALARVAGLGR
jgi:predicted ATP-grasp superfamily ATP-dependent carboligase